MTDRLGKYEIRGTLGKGAMGTVYAAWDPIISRQVAIKTVRLPDASDIDAQEELARFKREAQAAGRLTHPNIVGIFDYGETGEVAYIVMEFVDGRTLKSLVDAEERMPVATIGKIMADLLAGLRYSHDRGVVHRDIKPANVMIVGGDGNSHNSGQAKIADFGIARIESSNLTQAGTIMGTPAYMSPEQFMGQTVDQRTDIYSSGVLLFQLLTGERPFEGSMATIMHKALNVQPPKPSELSVTAPRALDPVVARAMARRPEDRYPTAGAFGEAIRVALAAPAPAADSILGGGLGDLDGEATVIQSAPRVRAAETGAAKPRDAGPREEAKRRSKTPVVAGVGFLVLVAAGGAAAFFAGAFNATPQPPSAPTTSVAAPTEGNARVVAVTPSTAPPPRENVVPPPPTQSNTQPAAQPPANAAPEPRPEVTQVVPPASEPRVETASREPTRTPAQIIPPAPTSNPISSSTSNPTSNSTPTATQPPRTATAIPAEGAGQAVPGRAQPPNRPGARADLGGVNLEPATVTPPAPAASEPDRPATAAPPPVATPLTPTPQPTPSTSANSGPASTSSPPPPATVPLVSPTSPPEPAPTVVATPTPDVTRNTTQPAPTTTTAEVGLSPEALRRSIASAAQGADCAVLQGDVARDGRLIVQGVIGARAAPAVLQQFRETAPTAPLDWTVREASGPYCGALNLVRAYARPFGSTTGGIEVGLKDGRTDLVTDDPIEVRTTMAGFPAYLEVDYFSSDGSVAHVRTASQGSPTVPARSGQSIVAGAAAPPFGTDLVVAIASSPPLFPKSKTLPETTDAYLRDLRTALDAAKQRRSELATGVVVVHTSEK